MGKHERAWAEEAEIAVTNALNGIASDKHIQKIADEIKQHINSKYNSAFKHAVWIGGESYDDKGDIKIFLADDTEIHVETKFSFEKGSGTKANTSTKVLKKYVDVNIKTYPEFDEELGLKKQRYNLVENRVGRQLRNNSDYTKTLRYIRDTGGEDFIELIAKVTSPGQEQYAEYASAAMNKHLDNVNKWAGLILSGNNTTKSLAKSSDLVYCVIKNFESKNQTVEFYDFTDMDSNITNVVASGKSIKLQNQSGKDVLRLSVTWKNICQGGQTPCFNVFVGNAFSS
jgi:hypothetical protein